MGRELVGAADAQQPADQAGVIEVQFRHLDEPFARRRAQRGQPEDHEAGLQDAQPRLGGGLGDAAVAGQRRVVDHLRGASRAELDETLERVEVADTAHGAHVPLDIGGHIGAEPFRRVEAAVEDGGIAPGHQRLVETVGVLAEADDLASGQGQQVQHRGAPGQGLADRFQQGQVL